MAASKRFVVEYSEQRISFFFFTEKHIFQSNRFSAIPNNISSKVYGLLSNMRFTEDASEWNQDWPARISKNNWKSQWKWLRETNEAESKKMPWNNVRFISNFPTVGFPFAIDGIHRNYIWETFFWKEKRKTLQLWEYFLVMETLCHNYQYETSIVFSAKPSIFNI